MDYCLTVYSRDTYEEYRLPCREAEECGITLAAARFGTDLRLRMEVRDGIPAFLPSGAFSLRPARGRRRFPLPVGEGEVFFLTPNGGGRLVLLSGTAAEPVVRCIAPEAGGRLTVGSAPENPLIYDRGNAVSGVHAVFTWTEDGCVLEDRSCNGVYVNRRRVEGSRRLEAGDRVHLCGLTLVFLGTGVALDVSAPGLRIREDVEPGMPDDLAAGYFQERGPESETVLVDEVGSEDETVYEGRGGSEDETVYEVQAGSEDETVYEGQAGSEDETVYEAGNISEARTAFEAGSEDETIWEAGDISEEETVFEGGADSEEETVFQRPDSG